MYILCAYMCVTNVKNGTRRHFSIMHAKLMLGAAATRALCWDCINQPFFTCAYVCSWMSKAPFQLLGHDYAYAWSWCNVVHCFQVISLFSNEKQTETNKQITKSFFSLLCLFEQNKNWPLQMDWFSNPMLPVMEMTLTQQPMAATLTAKHCCPQEEPKMMMTKETRTTDDGQTIAPNLEPTSEENELSEVPFRLTSTQEANSGTIHRSRGV